MKTTRTAGRSIAITTLALGTALVTATSASADETCPPTTPAPSSTAAPAPSATTQPTTTEAPAPEPSTTETPAPAATGTPAPAGDECDICTTVTPPAPAVTPVCGADNDIVSTTPAAGVAWEVGTWSHGAITVTAVSKPSYTFPAGDIQTFTFTDDAVPCETPAPTEPCDEQCPTAPVTPGGGTATPVTPEAPSTPGTVTPKGEGTPAAVTPTATAPTPSPTTTATPPVFNAGTDGASTGLAGAGALGILALAGALVARRRRNAA